MARRSRSRITIATVAILTLLLPVTLSASGSARPLGTGTEVLSKMKKRQKPATTSTTNAPSSTTTSSTTTSTTAVTAPTFALRVIDGTSANTNGPLPVLNNGTLTGGLFANVTSGRSEVMWGDENQWRLLFYPGDLVTTEFDVKPDLCGPNGELPPDNQSWHVVYQMHGSLRNNTWASGPPVSLLWQNGNWYLRGGYDITQADGTYTRAYKSQAPATPPAPCGVWQHWKIEQYLGGPGVGYVNAWLNGTQILFQWKPLAGTFYTEFGDYSHQALQLKNGIYAGGETPWARTVTEKNITVTRANASGTKTWVAQ